MIIFFANIDFFHFTIERQTSTARRTITLRRYFPDSGIIERNEYQLGLFNRSLSTENSYEEEDKHASAVETSASVIVI